MRISNKNKKNQRLFNLISLGLSHPSKSKTKMIKLQS